MSINLKTIKHISKLSRISVDEKKAEKLAGDLNSIFEFIEKLNELKTDNVQPLTSVAVNPMIPISERASRTSSNLNGLIIASIFFIYFPWKITTGIYLLLGSAYLY